MAQPISASVTPKTPRKTYHIRIKPSHGWVRPNFGELWQYRELLLFMALRDVQVRYKQTILGASWAIIQPFLTMVVFSLFFGRLAEIPSDGIPYPIFSYAALVPWTFFANSLTQSANSLVQGGVLIKRIYFPRLLMPVSTILATLVDFALAFIVLLGMMLFFNIDLSVKILALPYFILLAFVTSLGVSLWLSAMNVQFRDVRYIVPFLTQIWMFISPIAYPSSLIEDEVLRTLYSLNPMAGVVEGFRWALVGTDTEPTLAIVASSAIALLLFLSGLYYFLRMEKTFADVA